jgi:L-iditol 2-dehydrogenase
MHLCLARARGARRVIVADVDASRLALAERFGPDHSILAGQTEVVGEVRRLTDGSGPDVVITANSAPESQVQAVEMAARGGRILLFGGLPRDQSRPQIDTNVIHYNSLVLMGTTIYAPRHHAAALELLSSGRVPGDRLITHRLPLSDFRQGVELAMGGRALKVVFLS